MAYTRAWVEVLRLLGARDADEIDDASRETKVDLEERFTDILVDPAADPWRLKLPVDVKRLHFSQAFHVSSQIESLQTVNLLGYWITPLLANGGVLLQMALPIPVEGQLSLVRYRVRTLDATAAFTGKVFKVDSTGIGVQIGYKQVTGVVTTDFQDYDGLVTPTICGAGDVFYSEMTLQNPVGTGSMVYFLDLELTTTFL